MSKFDFVSYAAQLAAERGRAAMAPVIEKEIIHYDVLNSLDK